MFVCICAFFHTCSVAHWCISSNWIIHLCSKSSDWWPWNQLRTELCVPKIVYTKKIYIWYADKNMQNKNNLNICISILPALRIIDDKKNLVSLEGVKQTRAHTHTPFKLIRIDGARKNLWFCLQSKCMMNKYEIVDGANWHFSMFAHQYKCSTLYPVVWYVVKNKLWTGALSRSAEPNRNGDGSEIRTWKIQSEKATTKCNFSIDGHNSPFAIVEHITHKFTAKYLF